MNDRRWAEIEIEATESAVDAVGDILNSAGCSGFVVRDAIVPTTVAGYLPVDDRLEDRILHAKDALSQLSSFGVDGASDELTIRYVEEADWANAWKAYYKPIEIGRKLIVCPPWEDLPEGNERLAIIIDPGMAFGTGSHPTTQLCLAALEDYIVPGMRVADVGTGSGILAIAAAKLGAGPIVATDNDPLAVSIAAENIAENHVDVATQTAEPTGTFDLIVANILADVVIDYADRFAEWIRPGGTLIASGIIDARESDVRLSVECAGFTPLETQSSGEWVALVFRRLES